MFRVRAILNTVFLLFLTTALRNIYTGSGKGKYSLRRWKGRQKKTNQPTNKKPAPNHRANKYQDRNLNSNLPIPEFKPQDPQASSSQSVPRLSSSPENLLEVQILRLHHTQRIKLWRWGLTVCILKSPLHDAELIQSKTQRTISLSYIGNSQSNPLRSV